MMASRTVRISVFERDQAELAAHQLKENFSWARGAWSTRTPAAPVAEAPATTSKYSGTLADRMAAFAPRPTPAASLAWVTRFIRAPSAP